MGTLMEGTAVSGKRRGKRKKKGGKFDEFTPGILPRPEPCFEVVLEGALVDWL